MVASIPALTVAAGFIVSTIASDTAEQGPAGLSVVMVKVTVPTVISVAEGVYVAVKEVASLKVPVPDVVHVEEVALPPRVPERV